MSDSKYIIRRLEDSDYVAWDDLVDCSPQGLIFHKLDWIITSATLFNTNIELVGIFDEKGDIVAGVPLFTNKKYGMPYIISNLPLSPTSGFLLSAHASKNIKENEQTDKLCLALFSQYIKNKRTVLSIVNNYPEMIDLRPLIQNGWKSKLGYTYYLTLDVELWNDISRKTRNTIRKGEKENIEVKIEYNPEEYWKLTEATYQKQNMKIPFTREYITSLMDMAIKHNFGEMWVAKMPNGDIASAEFILWDNKMVHRWSAASNTGYKNTGATSLLLYNIFIEMKKRGHKKINLVAANTPHLTKFVSGFNPTLTPYYTCIYSPFFKNIKII